MIVSTVDVKVVVTFPSGLSIVGSFATEQDANDAAYGLNVGELPATMSADGARRYANFAELVHAAGAMK